LLRRLLVVVLLGAALPVWADKATEEANIARMTAALLQQSHFSARRQNGDVSVRFLEQYLRILDGARLHFLESDVQEFAPYRETLEKLTLQTGDTTPAQRIFSRFLERLEQRTSFATNLLAQEKFEFFGKETFLLEREKAPRPADLAAAKELWRQQLRFEYLQEKLNKKQPAAIVQTLTKRYERNWKTMKQFTEDQVFESYLNALSRVYDPHSDYMGRRQLEEFGISMRLSLFGIGAVLSFEDGYSKIRELVPGGPAATSKQIKPGDRIVTVAQEGKEPVDCIEMPLSDTVQLIRGPKGTQVTLSLIPAEARDAAARKTVTLVRDEIKLESQQAKARVVDWPTGKEANLRFGVIDLPSFYVGDGKEDANGRSGCTADVAKLIEKLKAEKVQGLILDLRRNGGGSLEEAIALSGLFIESGPVVQTKDADGTVRVMRDPDKGVLYDGPLVVMTSRISASASEILAGALQNYGRALIVGDDSTFGKGTVQQVIQLAPLMQRHNLNGGENPGALKLTIRKFYLPEGASTQLKGVVPDLVLPSALSIMKIGEANMPESLPWDEVPTAPHAQLNRTAPYLAALREKSAARISANQEFQWLRDDLERAKKQRDNPIVSLNEQERLQETAEQEVRDKTRQKIRAKRPPAAETQYEITIKNADTTGLPPALTNASAAVSSPVDDADDENKTPVPDFLLDEGKRILADYVQLLAAVPVAPTNETAQTR
jgi:carboxyl-terminal processing protease